MTDEFIEGYWWTPAPIPERVPGTLTAGPSGKLTLSLMGAFGHQPPGVRNCTMVYGENLKGHRGPHRVTRLDGRRDGIVGQLVQRWGAVGFGQRVPAEFGTSGFDRTAGQCCRVHRLLTQLHSHTPGIC